MGNARCPLQEVIDSLVQWRRANALSVGLHRSGYDLFISCDAGRIQRPLLVVRNNKLAITKEDLKKLKKNKYTVKDL